MENRKIDLYTAATPNGHKVSIALEELGLAYSLRVLDLSANEQKGATALEGALACTLVPARQWSMRAPWDRNDSLWGGWVLRGPEGTAYHAGDTAYFDGFAEIGRRCGPIDWARLPTGAYAPPGFMEPQHMDPEDSVRAFGDLGARVFVAMHWGTFKLTDEPLHEPPETLQALWEAAGRDPSRLWVLAVGETRPLVR